MSAKKFAMPRTRTNRNAVEPENNAGRFIQSLFNLRFARAKMGIDGENFSSAHDQKKKSAEQHAKIGARFMRHAPETVARQFWQTESPETIAEQDWNFR